MIEPFVRVLYREGMILAAADLAAAERYVLGKMRLHNRICIGACVIDGFEVEGTAEGYRVGPGLAFDCRGRELVSGETLAVEGHPGGHDSYVLLAFHETPSDAVTLPGAEGPAASRVVEGVRASFGDSDLPRTHARTTRGWAACGSCGLLPIARVRGGRVLPVTPGGQDVRATRESNRQGASGCGSSTNRSA